MFYLFPVSPEFLKCSLYYVPCIFLMPQVFHDKTKNTVSIKVNTLVVFLFRHSWVGRGVAVVVTILKIKCYMQRKKIPPISGNNYLWIMMSLLTGSQNI